MPMYRCHCSSDSPCQVRRDWREILDRGYPRWSLMHNRITRADSPFTYQDFEERREKFRALHGMFSDSVTIEVGQQVA